MTIEVKNDAMLGRTTDSTLHIELIKLQQENKQLKEDYQVLRTTNISLNDLVNSCQKEIRKLKEEINKMSKKELKVMAMLRSIELCTLTKERIDQIEEVMFELEGNND